MPSPSRAKLKKAMLAIFLEKDKLKKKQCSTKFTRLLFQSVGAQMRSKSKDEIAIMQMQAVGLFTNYLFRKNKEKSGEKGKSAEETLREIADESDELFDEIEASIIHSA